MSSDVVAALGAFLSGIGAVLGAWFTIGRLRKRMRQECEEKIALFRRGIEVGEQHHREEEQR